MKKILLLAIVASLTAQAQTDTLKLTLHECIRRALEDGPSVVAAREAYRSKAYAYKSFRSSLYPQLSLQGQAPGYFRSISPITQPDGTTIFTPQSQASSTLNLSLSQKIPLTGGEISLSSGLNRVDLLETNTIYYRSTPLSVTYRQPLFQVNTLRWDSEAEELRIDIARKEWEESLEDISIDVTNKFFSAYLAFMNVEGARANVEINDTLFQISKGRFNLGKIAENDLLQSELALLNAQTQLDNASIAYERAVKDLSFALGLSKTVPLRLQPPSEVPEITLDPVAATEQALQNRSDMTTLELNKQTAERSIAQAELDNSFSATLTANAGLNQRASEVPMAYRNLMDQQQLSINFEVPIVQWGAGSSKVESALAQKQQTETVSAIRRNAIEEEVIAQVKSLQLLQRQVGISAKADTIAQRRFDVSKDRYLIGKIDVTNLFLAQNEKDSARRARTQTLWDFWAGYYRLRRLTLYDFAANKPLHRLFPLED